MSYNELVSIIVPIYNAEKYVSRTIESIMTQSYENIEIILIDDGSTDSSRDICEQYALKDNRIRYIYQKNRGRCHVRNKGVEIAKGKYIIFCDNDDLMVGNLIEDNIYLMKKYKADFVKFAHKNLRGNSDGYIASDFCYGDRHDLIFIDNQQYDITKLLNEGWLTYIWDAIFSVDFLRKNKILFDEIYLYGHEDIIYIQEAYSYSKKIVINPNVYYVHFTHGGMYAGRFYEKQLDLTQRLLDTQKKIFAHNKKNHLVFSICKKKYAQYIFHYLSNPQNCVSYNTLRCQVEKYLCNQQIEDDGFYKNFIKKYLWKLMIILINKRSIKLLSVFVILRRNIARIMVRL